jgi:hypothetical protein
MRVSTIAAVSALALTTVAAVFAGAAASAQSAPQQPTKILGHMNTQTGEFHPVSHLRPDTTATPPTTGKYVFTFDITVESTFPKGAQLVCAVDLIEEASITTTTAPYVVAIDYEEEASSTIAAPAAGGKATCVVDIPYSWQIPATPTGGKFTNNPGADYTISVYDAPSSSISGSILQSVRTESSGIPISATLPKDGAITTATINATI